MLRSLEKAWIRSRRTNTEFPKEFLGWQFEFSHCYSLFNWIFQCNINDIRLKIVIQLVLRLWCQSDNTVKEVRNTYGQRMLCALLQGGVFRRTSEHHLVVGHTHEDIDSVFSLVTACLKSSPQLETPSDILRRIDTRVGPLFRDRGLEFSIELVSVVSWDVEVQKFFLMRKQEPQHNKSFGIPFRLKRNSQVVERFFKLFTWNFCGAQIKARAWTEILPDAVTFKNAFRARKPDEEGGQRPVPNSFTYMPRSGTWIIWFGTVSFSEHVLA